MYPRNTSTQKARRLRPLKRTDVVLSAQSYLGVPFVDMGRTRQGLDCLGLLIAIANDVGLSVAQEDQNFVYSKEPDGRLLRAKLSKYMRTIPYSVYQPGDVVLMLGTPTDNGFPPCHLGIFESYTSIIQALSRGDVKEVIRSPFHVNSSWFRKARGYLSWPNLL